MTMLAEALPWYFRHARKRLESLMICMKVDSRSDVRTVARCGEHPALCKRPNTALQEGRTDARRHINAAKEPERPVIRSLLLGILLAL